MLPWLQFHVVFHLIVNEQSTLIHLPGLHSWRHEKQHVIDQLRTHRSQDPAFCLPQIFRLYVC